MEDNYSKINENSKLKFGKADIFILIEFLVSVGMAVISHFFLRQEIITGTVLMVGILITMSTYILKNHVINENRKQTEENKKYLERVKLWVDIEHHKDIERREKGVEIISKAEGELNKILQGTWQIQSRFDLDAEVKKCVKNAKNSILATHINVKGWRESQSSKEIFEENKRAIERDVRIHRIFILFDKELKDPLTKEIMEKHKKIGVKVECVKNTEIPPDKVKDFIIFDDKKVIIENLSPDFKRFTDGIVLKNEQEIKEWMEIFRKISTQASEDLNKFFGVAEH